MRIKKRCAACGTYTDDCPSADTEGRKHGTKHLKFQAIVELGYFEGRRKRSTRTFDREGAAKDWAAEIEAEVRRGDYIEPSEQTLASYLQTWLDTAHLGRKPSTLRSYADAFRLHVTPNIGQVKLGDLRAPMIRKVYARLIDGGKSPKSVRNIHAALRKALADGVRDGLLRANPADTAFDGIKVPKKKLPSWSIAEMGRFLEAVEGHQLEREFEFGLLTGCRRGEVLGLRWSDVDLDSGMVTIGNTVIRDGNNGVGFSSPKSEHSSEPFKLNPGLIPLLEAQRVDQLKRRMQHGPAWVDSDLVFDRGDGRFHDPDVFSQTFGRVVEQHGLPKIPLHGMRHTLARAILTSGGSAKLVQKQLRHHSAAFSLDQYGDTDVGAESAVVADIRRAAAGG